jgi:hypothetical protein
MGIKNRQKGGRRSALSFEVDDLFGQSSEDGAAKDGGLEGVAEVKLETPRGKESKVEKVSGPESNSKPKSRGEEDRERKQVRRGRRAKEAGSKDATDPNGSRWKAPRGFHIFDDNREAGGGEHLRVHRRCPSPEIFDETLFRLLPALPGRAPKNIFCAGGVFPAVVAAAAGSANKLTIGDMPDQRAVDAVFQLIPDAVESVPETGKYDLVLFCHDHLTGEKAAEAVVEASGWLAEGGVLVACFPAEALLDYSTNIRMEAPNMRNRIHRLCRTHFILRAAGPLMQPSWDMLVMSKRGGQADVPICKWRFTGNGVLPWQKCNEAFSGAPWLLVETIDQAGPAIARCIHYPWEPFALPD